MWIVCITSVRHVLTVNGYGGRQTKENEKSWCFKGWETLEYNKKREHLVARMPSFLTLSEQIICFRSAMYLFSGLFLLLQV